MRLKTPNHFGPARLLLAAALLIVLSPSAAAGMLATPTTLHLPALLRAGNPIHTGIATYYNATGDGACMFGPSPADLMVAAINADEWAGSGACGTYVRVSGPKGSVQVRIVDLCPGCSKGHLDLSQEAFAKIANLVDGRVTITWQVLSPLVSGPIAYRFKEGSSQWWTAVQVRNHRNPVAKLEYKNSSGVWVNVPRSSYNYFIQSSGMGVGPYAFRVTDIYGRVLTDASIGFVEAGVVNGAGQFPVGP